MITKIHKNIFKAAQDATASDHCSMTTIVSCFGGQKLKRDFASHIVLYRNSTLCDYCTIN